MFKRFARIFGATGGALTLLVYLALIGYCAYRLAQPEDYEGKGLYFAFIVVLLAPALISAAGFIGSFYVGKKHILAGVMMIISGVLTISASLWFAFRFGLPEMLYENTVFLAWLYLLPQLILVFAGVLSLLHRPDAAADKQKAPQ